MKNAILFLTIFMFLKPVLPVLDYVINYDYIVTELCENKTKPELQCNGKCSLAKELAKASEAENPINSNKEQNEVKQKVEILFFEDIKNATALLNFSQSQEEKYFFYNNTYGYIYLTSIYHPPIFIG